MPDTQVSTANARAQHFLSIDSSTDEKPALGNLLTAANNSSPDQNLERSELWLRLHLLVLALHILGDGACAE